MKKLASYLITFLFLLAPVFAQHNDRHGGFVPHSGPAPTVHSQSRGEIPHVQPPRGVFRHEQWRGHVTTHENQRLRLERPFEHGRFPGGIGRDHRFILRGFHSHRFFIDGFFFEVFPDDLIFCNNWLWNGDQVVIYEDVNDPGWYLAYNVRLGTYIHVQYLGVR